MSAEYQPNLSFVSQIFQPNFSNYVNIRLIRISADFFISQPKF